MLLNTIMAVSENILELQKEVEEFVCYRSDEIGKEPIRIELKGRSSYFVSSFGVILQKLGEDRYALDAYAINDSGTYERSKGLLRGTYVELLEYVETYWTEDDHIQCLCDALEEYAYKAGVDFYFMESDWEEHKYLLEE